MELKYKLYDQASNDQRMRTRKHAVKGPSAERREYRHFVFC